MNDYTRIATVIEYLVEHYRDQPDLEELASVVGLSAYHFHRLFSRWAGITPKTFLQCLTAQEAKRLLRGGTNVLDTALDVGLSGPSRLHDLCIGLEAASPGEIKSGGAGWEVAAGFAETPFGRALIADGPRGICWLSFVGEDGSCSSEWSALQANWPGADLSRDDDRADSIARSAFHHGNGQPAMAPLKAVVKGTAFQTKVWRALLGIPFGTVRSYGDVARGLGMPGAARAVGNAAGRNGLAFLVPCHRVIAATGMVGNYRWGGIRKRALLAWEQSIRTQQAP